MAAESRAKKAAASDDGSATQRTYMRAVELMRGGHSGKAAFEQIAAETGESAGTVQARYYRVARKAGEVQRRPRSKAPAAKAAAAPKARAARGSRKSAAAAPAASTNSLASQLDAAAKLLQTAASEIRSLEGDAEKWRQIRPLLDAR
ncbi:MAG: hypothetical protein QOE98_2614 [Gaiellaceae bacterium]|jgi:hypothetical protein|nr:hypothetical protein [Gaiellaceae bacterium]